VAFLNHGILEMLTTRLLKAGTLRVKAWSKSPYDGAAALDLAEKQEADYILVGSVTIFDDRVSTDARLLRAGDGQAVLLFSRFGGRPGDVLEHVDLLAGEMVKLFGGRTTRKKTAAD
jgi:TolB-like protein